MEGRERRKGYEMGEKKGKRGLSKRQKEGCKRNERWLQTNKERAAN